MSEQINEIETTVMFWAIEDSINNIKNTLHKIQMSVDAARLELLSWEDE